MHYYFLTNHNITEIPVELRKTVKLRFCRSLWSNQKIVWTLPAQEQKAATFRLPKNLWGHSAVKSCQTRAARLATSRRAQSHVSISRFQSGAAGRMCQMCRRSFWLHMLRLQRLEQRVTRLGIDIYFHLGVKTWWNSEQNIYWSFIS